MIKKLKIFIILTIFSFLIYSLFISLFKNNYIITEHLWLSQFTDLLSLSLVSVTLFYLFKEGSRVHHAFQKDGRNIFLSTLIIVFSIPFIISLILKNSIPVVLHDLTKTPANMTVTIDEVIYRKRCSNGVSLVGYDFLSNGRVCGLKQEILENVQYGDTLKLYGEVSRFAFSYSAYKYIPEPEIKKTSPVQKRQEPPMINGYRVDLEEIKRYLQ